AHSTLIVDVTTAGVVEMGGELRGVAYPFRVSLVVHLLSSQDRRVSHVGSAARPFCYRRHGLPIHRYIHCWAFIGTDGKAEQKVTVAPHGEHASAVLSAGSPPCRRVPP